MSCETVLVTTKNGPVRGRKRISTDQMEYVSFQGIPFAKPPVGELRFKDPVPADNWTEPIDALQQPAVAYALDFATYQIDPRSSEDCLYLNVYTRNVPQPATTNGPRPVMLFIHPGGFMLGNTDEAMLSPEFLLRADIVFVTVAYRLGAFGFLSVADPAQGVPGNAGLKDQTLGMRWVRDNIAAFGGDPDNVTLFGVSAGGASVHYHMLSDYSRGLFQRAIVQSGNALSRWAQQPRRDVSAALARRLGWQGEGGAEGMMRVLRAADPKEIVFHQHLEETEDKQRGNYFMFVPRVEPYGQADSGKCFLPRAPELLAKTAWGNSIPMMTGCSTDEGYLFYKLWKADQGMFDDDRYFKYALPSSTDALSLGKRVELTGKLMRHYYGDQRPSQANLVNFVRLQSDKLFWKGCLDAIRARNATADNDGDGIGAPTFLYRFSFDSKLPAFWPFKLMSCGERVDGAIHGEEMMFMFKFAFIDYGSLDAGSPELKVIDNMFNIWTTFAATGDPNGPKLDQQWQPVKTGSGFKCMDVSDQLNFIDLPEEERISFWDALERKV